MKKITLFLALMVTMVTTAFAQFTQTMAEIKSDVAQLSSVPEAVTANMSSSDGYVSGTCVVKSYSCDVTVATAGDVTVNFKYTGGSHGLVILGVDLLNANGEAVYYEYANGRTPVKNNSKETYTLSGVAAGDYVLRYIFCHRQSDHEVGNQQADITVTNAVLKKTLPEGVLNNVDDLSNTALYTIVAQDTNRGALYARTSDNYLTSTGKQGKSIDAADPDQQFMFIKKGAKTYLYSVGAGKCVNDEGSNLNLTESRNHYVVVEKQGTGYMKIKMNGSDLINISNGRDYGTCADYNSVDGGNVFTITKVGEASASVISAALATDFAPVDVAKRYYLETTVGGVTQYLKYDSSLSTTKTKVVTNMEEATVFAFENVVDGYNKYYTLSTGEGSSKMYIETSHNWNITANTSGSNVWLEQESETSITYFINNPRGYFKAQNDYLVFSDGNNSNRTAWSLVEKLYTITYKVDGVVTSTEQLSCGAAITPMAAPTKTGHTFSGWSTIPATMPASDVVIEGTFAVNNYTVTYLVDGQQFTTATVAYGAEIPALENQPVKAGHTFKGWANVPETMPAANVTLTAEFEINSYIVTYLADDKEFTTATVVYGEAIPALTEQPEKEGYTFIGWGEIPSAMPAANVTLNAVFEVNYYTITYYVDGEVYDVQTVAYGAEIMPLQAPEKICHTFNGWSNMPTVMPADNVEVYAMYGAHVFQVVYMVDDNIYAQFDASYGSPVPTVDDPVKVGYTFEGWGDVPSTVPANGITLHAKFTPNTYVVRYVVDNITYEMVDVEYGSIISLIPAPEKEGYTFSGWSEFPATMPAEEVIIEGSFTINSYSLVYKVDGEVYETLNVEYGSALTAIAAPEKEGQTFGGWSTLPETMPAEEVVIEGSFTVNSYSLVYKVDGEVYKTFTVEYGSALTAIAAPEKEGHTFSGWSTLPETMPAEEVVIEGSFTVNSYSLVYKVDGEVYETLNVEYGSALTAIDAPEKEGHTFGGWSTLPSTMPAKEVVISGSFTINTYTVTFIIDNDETVVELEYGAEIELPSDVIWENEENIPETMPAENIVIKGAKITTNIKFVNIDDESVIYDLNGQRILDIENIESGIYIINGKKVYVK